MEQKQGAGSMNLNALLGDWCRAIVTLAVVVVLLVCGYLVWLWNEDTPTDYADVVEHFKYGSTGGERESGFPLWIWKALPQVCAEHLPDKGFASPGAHHEDGKGYAAFGMIYETGHDLPVGASKRSVMGIERTFLNCAACHTSTVRKTEQSGPEIYAGMPANTFNVMAFEKFFFDCSADPKFSGEFIIPDILSGGNYEFVGNVIGDQFQQAQNQPFGSALAIALMAVLSVFVVVYIMFARKEERFGG